MKQILMIALSSLALSGVASALTPETTGAADATPFAGADPAVVASIAAASLDEDVCWVAPEWLEH